MGRGVVLNVSVREEISRLLPSGISFREIGRELDRDHTVISREVGRNGGRREYRAHTAQTAADARLARPKDRKIETDERLLAQVNTGLGQQWSPRQISKRLVIDFPDDDTMRVSHEQIYQALYFQARGQLKVQLLGQLRRGGTTRVSRAQRREIAENRKKVIPAMTMITERPPEVEDRAVPGHWEGDLIMGAGNRSAIITLVERSTRFVLLGKLNYDHTAARTSLVLSNLMGTLPDLLRCSLTWDQGREMARHESFTITTGIPVFFCDPHSPWQRGSNENTNGLLRQYFPKGEDLHQYSQSYLDAVAAELNGRPRETLGWRTPAEKLADTLSGNSGALTT